MVKVLTLETNKKMIVMLSNQITKNKFIFESFFSALSFCELKIKYFRMMWTMGYDSIKRNKIGKMMTFQLLLVYGYKDLIAKK